MGQEIDKSSFDPEDFERFHVHLAEETRLLADLCASGHISAKGPMTGFELEGWLIDEDMRPAPVNDLFLERLGSPEAGPELARFNVEFNTAPLSLKADVLSRMKEQLTRICRDGEAAASALGIHLLMIGTLPTVTKTLLNAANLSAMKRYRALNEQVLAARANRPIQLDIVGHQRLHCEHDDVTLEAATTSFQIHWQCPGTQVGQTFNAALVMSAPLVAVGANSPFLFGYDLWAETRIPLFEQAVAVGGYAGASSGPIKRVGFGSGYAKSTLVELFEENLAHYPVILPICFDSPPEHFAHLRLHNGTIWRWNRPLVGFDDDGSPHFRFEHRILPAGPTVVDMMANAALFFGLVAAETPAMAFPAIPFSQVRDNFYAAAQHGLKAHVVWLDGERHGLRSLLLKRLLPQAAEGLAGLGIERGDIGYYMDIIERRVDSGQTGSEWQRGFLATRRGAFTDMMRAYLDQQHEGRPVSEWRL